MRTIFKTLVAVLGISVHLCAAPITSQVILQPVIVQDSSSQAQVERDFTFAQAIFSQIGIGIVMLPTDLSATLPTNMPSFGSLDTYLTDSSHVDSPFLTIWYVTTIGGPGSGIRGESFGQFVGTDLLFGVGIAASHANDTLAHEVAHILTGFSAQWQPNPGDPAHSTDPTNLLASGNIRYTPSTLADVGTIDQIQPIQIAMMSASQFDQDTPEPGTWGLLLIGTAFFAIRRRAE